MANHLLIESTRVPADTWVQITLTVAIVIIGLFATFITLAAYGTCEAVVTAIIAVACLYGSIVNPLTIYEKQPVPLSRISEQVHVTDSKVVIDKLPENIRYEPKQFQGVKERQIFVFSYDETFETGKLTSASGETFVLLDEDTKFLKERGAKNG